MSITLTYNSDLSRVQIAAASLIPAEVRVERSRNELHWQTVRGGLAVEPSSGAIALDDYEFDADVTNHYRIVDTSDDSVEESDSITPDLAGRVWWKSIRWPFLNRPVRVSNWGEIGRGSRSTVHQVAGRSVPVATHDLRTSRGFTLTLITEDLYDPSADGLAEAGIWDLTVAAGGTFFIHVPAGSPVPGGYVAIGDTAEDRVVRYGTAPYVLTLPCTVVAPPGPQIVGGTMTYGALLNLYGGYSNMLAANPTYADLLALMASPDDLVVL